MDGILAWLATPAGQGLAHAVELLITATAAYFSARAAHIAKGNRERLNGHLQAHMRRREPKDAK